MQRRKISDHESDDEVKPPPAPRFRITKSIAKSERGLTNSDIILIVGALALMLCIPLYAVASSLKFSTATLASPFTGGRQIAAEQVVSGLFQGAGSGRSVYVAGYRTKWADENRTWLEQVAIKDAFPTCSNVASFVEPVVPGYRMCVDGQEGSFPEDTSACVVYTVGLVTEEPGPLDTMQMERELAERGCEVHVFSPLLTRASASVDVDELAGVPAVPPPTKGSLTLHGLMAAADDYDPKVATDGRHPDTLRQEQLWRRLPLSSIMARLGHRSLTMLRVVNMEGREWPLLHTCFVYDVDGCGGRVGSLQWEAFLIDREHGLSSNEVEVHALTNWAETVTALVMERPYGHGFKQVDRAIVRGGGTVSLGLSPAGPSVQNNPTITAALATSISSVIDGSVAKQIRTTYIRRSMDNIVNIATGGEFESAAAYTASRKSSFCSEADSLAKAEHGEHARVHSPECPDLGPEETAGEEQGQAQEGTAGQDTQETQS